jgi:protein transport protein SEC61 subunit gamma-like protein
MGVTKFIGECQRVLKVTRKPTMPEFKTVVKASGLGILVIGALGFIVYMISQALV